MIPVYQKAFKKPQNTYLLTHNVTDAASYNASSTKICEVLEMPSREFESRSLKDFAATGGKRRAKEDVWRPSGERIWVWGELLPSSSWLLFFRDQECLHVVFPSPCLFVRLLHGGRWEVLVTRAHPFETRTRAPAHHDQRRWLLSHSLLTFLPFSPCSMHSIGSQREEAITLTLLSRPRRSKY